MFPESLRDSPLALGLFGLLSVALILEILPRLNFVPAQFFPPTSVIVLSAFRVLARSAAWAAIASTLWAWVIGLTVSTVAAVVVGMLIGSSRVATELTASTIEFLRPIPSVALIPLAAVLYGTTIGSELLLIIYACFWQVLIQTLYGIRDVDPVAADTARAYRLGRLRILRVLVWPTALPFIATGVRLAASIGLILAVTAELIIGNDGLGQALLRAENSGDFAGLYAWIGITGLLGVAVNGVFRSLERRVLHWHPRFRETI